MLSILLLLVCLDGGVKTDNITIVRNFPLPEDNDMMDPHHMDFSPRGDLYVLERLTPRVHHWNAEGEYQGFFGKEGQGPGELSSPQLLFATDKALWVWDHAGNFSLFDLDGTFIRRVIAPPVRIRRFAVLRDDLIVFAFQRRDPKETRIEFHLANDKGESIELLFAEKNEMFITQVKGDDNAQIKAFGPEADIVSDKKGTTYIVYSQNRKVMQLNAEGKIEKEFSISFPTSEPNDYEIESIKNMQFVGERGKVYNMKTMPDLSINYSYDKAYYTHLHLIGDKAAGVLTPVSGFDQLKGYHEASYVVVEFKDGGKPLARGSYRFPVDSQVFYTHGRAVAAFINDEGLFQIAEIGLKGL